MKHIILSLALLAIPALSHAEDLTATVLDVHDGDTIKVSLHGELPALFRTMLVRVRGCDTPELRDERQEVRALAQDARAFTQYWLPAGSEVVLRSVSWDKYGGRILADVDGLCVELISAGLAKEYRGKGGKPW